MGAKSDITKLLKSAQEGRREAAEDLFQALQREMHIVARGLMKRERPDHTLQPTALLNEVCLRLLTPDALKNVTSRRTFFAAANRGMQQILVDHARARNSQKRGGEIVRSAFDVILDTLEARDNTNIIELRDALNQLRQAAPIQAEVAELRFFSGLQNDEIAEILECSVSKVKREWTIASTRLFDMLSGDTDSE